MGKANNPGFISHRLEQVAQAVGLAVPIYRGKPTEKCIFNKESSTYPVMVEFDSGDIVHLGLNIFSSEIKKENPVIYRFVERYMLELLSLYTSSEVRRIMDSDGVSIVGNVDQVIGKDFSRMLLQYTTTDNERGTVSIETNKGELLFSITFPLNINLLSGMDKAELDAFFFKSLCAYQSENCRAIPDNLARVGKNLYLSENGYYETPAVRNSSFFRKHHSTYYPVCESKLPMESIMTLLTAYPGDKQYTVHLVQHAYGYSRVEVDVPMMHMLSYCLTNGCTPYVGIEECNNKGITASLFMVNENLGYCHTFKFTADIAILDNETGLLNASVHTFTPIHSLSR